MSQGIILHSGRLSAYAPWLGTKQERLFSLPFFFKIEQELLPTAVRQEKSVENIHIGKEEIKLPLFAN